MSRKYNQIPIELENEIIKRFTTSTINMANLARELGTNPTTVRNVLKRNGICTNKVSCIGLNFRKFNLDDMFFESINSNVKAYFLGLMYADGYLVIEGNGTKRVGIDLTDLDVLEKFSDSIKFEGDITSISRASGYAKGNSIYRLKFTSPKLYNDLINLGCLEHKTDILTFPNCDSVPFEFIDSFLLGYFDGDGSLYSHSRKSDKFISGTYEEYTLSFTGTKEFLTGIKSYLGVEHIKLGKRWDNDSNTYELKISGNFQVYKILKKMYSKTDVCMDRKYSKFKELEEYIVARNSNVTI